MGKNSLVIQNLVWEKRLILRFAITVLLVTKIITCT